MLPERKLASEAQLDQPAVVAPRPIAARRILEACLAACALVLLAPWLAAIALAIKLDDNGSIFYSQLRVGRDFRLFRLLKFRTMVVGADQSGLLTQPSDRRITRVGYWLRNFKLDELPQLFNVLRGDMQLVGPRPEVEPYVLAFRPQYSLLLQDRPGITDPASIAYRREEDAFRDGLSIEEQYLSHILPDKLRLSIDYQRRRTLGSDLKLLFQTVLGL